MPVIEPLLLSTIRVCTYVGEHLLTNASGFFFARDQHLFLVTSRHVLMDEPSRHFPDRIEVEVHSDPNDMGASCVLSVPLYRDSQSLWRQGQDLAGNIDVALIEIERATLPASAVYHAFTPAHLQWSGAPVEVGTTLLVVGFPLGFHDNLHHMPVVRHAVLASSFGLRFQGQGYFLTDARTHRGTSGAPVVMRAPATHNDLDELPWLLLGIHSARIDLGSRDLVQDEALGLNCTWYADILLTLSESCPFKS
ncbi:S1 family peptidase [Pseudomonas sp. Gutcm_11s]|uniref:S1 family peptidase n=1 Tax=Pseudomonas sp. Gutcm_11s TaxID=3026088 RepID=UPI0023614F72|nr:serine protease [Pseudomonas sp. Gutcm_11s]MDD0841433.1 serine protease [Pseudomonas sp. Gutcm_11s]